MKGKQKSKKQRNQKARQNVSNATNDIAKWIIGGTALIAVIILAFILFMPKAPEVATFDYSNQPYVGNPDAPVKIIEFGDYKCPACKSYNEQAIPTMKKEFVDSGQAQIIFMNYAFLSVDSTRSAKFAEVVFGELGNDTFWKFHDHLFTKQPDNLELEKQDVFTDEFLEKTVLEVTDEAQTAQVIKAYKEGKYEGAFQADMTMAEAAGINGTPVIFVNGERYKGNSFADLKKMVDKAFTESSVKGQ
ncbi:DsbA family protein [Brevibacillus daliensis]|uniref:DsbA family protein n=1 Tax=Brevibacillus daliensis TaxID=2892995 RepID=UPI001E519408|nr:thioredoxin domain-containing protein [Brevibacillus daliensis]